MRISSNAYYNCILYKRTVFDKIQYIFISYNTIQLCLLLSLPLVEFRTAHTQPNNTFDE